MTRFSTSAAVAALLALTACGSGADDTANNAADTNLTELPQDDPSLTADTGLVPADEIALGTDLNAADANLSADFNASENVTNAQ